MSGEDDNDEDLIETVRGAPDREIAPKKSDKKDDDKGDKDGDKD